MSKISTSIEYLEYYLNTPSEQLSASSSSTVLKALQLLVSKKVNISITPKKCIICKKKEFLNKSSIFCACGSISHKKCLKELSLLMSDDLDGSKIKIICPKCGEKLIWKKSFSNEELTKIQIKTYCPICDKKLENSDDLSHESIEDYFYQCYCRQKFHKSCLKERATDILRNSSKIVNFSQIEIAKKTREFHCPSCLRPINFLSCFIETEKEKILENKENMKAIKILLEADKKNNSYITYECMMCNKVKNVDQEFITLDCDHKFCKKCVENTIITNIEQCKYFEQNISCPVCLTLISLPIIKAIIDDEKFKQYDEFILHNSQKIYDKDEKIVKCPNAKCSYFCIINKNSVISHHKCQKCQEDFCLKGCPKAHIGKTCEDVRNEVVDSSKNDKDAKEPKIRKCPKCNVVVEKIMNDNHITCKCGTDFCFLCGTLDWIKCGDHKNINTWNIKKCVIF